MPALRYAILRHEGIAEPHFDLLFETLPGSALATWRSSRWPIEFLMPVTRVKDHRRIYLEFEGQLSERRGSVRRVAGGACEVDIGENAIWTIRILDDPASKGLILKQIAGERWEAMPLR